MEYLKLVALKLDDFCSSIFFEDNYALTDIEEVTQQKEELESKGYVCILANVKSGVEILNQD